MYICHYVSVTDVLVLLPILAAVKNLRACAGLMGALLVIWVLLVLLALLSPQLRLVGSQCVFSTQRSYEGTVSFKSASQEVSQEAPTLEHSSQNDVKY